TAVSVPPEHRYIFTRIIKDLMKSVKDTKSISSTLKDKISQIKDTVSKIDIKPTSIPEKTL
ncbi:MAG: hypothetical protein LUF34_07465, partial [Lachnospiraceae bacterium]|nr:hypothetical protein [Lachnospiraceae bacterium]